MALQVASALAGCDSGATVFASSDAPALGWPDATVQTVSVPPGRSLSIGCIGNATVPVGGALSEESVQLAAAAVVDLWRYPPASTGACVGPECTTATSDAAGNALLTEPLGSWVALHAHAGSAQLELFWMPLEWGPPITTAGRGFDAATIGLIASLLGRQWQVTQGVVSGQIHDCAGQTLAGVNVRVYVGGAEVVTGFASDRTSPRITGMEGTSPTRSGLTGDGGTFAAVNVPLADTCHVEAWGVFPGESTPQLIGCEVCVVGAGALSVVTIGPLRTDYAAGSECALAPRR